MSGAVRQGFERFDGGGAVEQAEHPKQGDFRRNALFFVIFGNPADVGFHHVAGVEAGFFFFKKPLDLVAFADIGVVGPARRDVIAEQAQCEGVAFVGLHGGF